MVEGLVDNGCFYTKDVLDFCYEIFSKEHISYGKVNELNNNY